MQERGPSAVITDLTAFVTEEIHPGRQEKVEAVMWAGEVMQQVAAEEVSPAANKGRGNQRHHPLLQQKAGFPFVQIIAAACHTAPK